MSEESVAPPSAAEVMAEKHARKAEPKVETAEAEKAPERAVKPRAKRK